VTATPPLGTLGALTWYFAEGWTGPGFDEYLTIQNPNPTDATVRITYFLSSGGPVEKTVTVAGSSRYTVTVHETQDGVGRNDGLGWPVSAKVESTNDVGIIVERPMYFRYSGDPALGTVDGGHNVLGVQSPRQTWLFAEGWTGPGFDQYLTIMNPWTEDAPVTITYFLNGSQTQVERRITVRAASRYTVTVHDLREGVGRDQEVSARVETSLAGGVVVERPMYFRYVGSLGGVPGGHNVMGAAAARTTWFFPDGITDAGYDEYLTIMNGTATAANVRLTYYVVGESTPRVKTITVAANSRDTVVVHDSAEGVGRGVHHGTMLESTNGVPLVVERPLYFRHNGSAGVVPGGDTVMGVDVARQRFFFAEGYTGPGFDEYLVILNPAATTANVQITYVRSSGPPIVKTLTVPGASRVTVAVHDTSQGVGRDQAVSALVESTNGVGIVVERPIFFDYHGTLGGHTIVGWSP
jgi:hypothetical protein